MIKKILLSTLLLFSFSTKFVSAHCPLCTIGAGAAAGGAVWLGVSKVVVALFIGAFAMSMGMWFARAVEKRKKFIPFQSFLILTSVFLFTVFPLIPIFESIGPLYLSFVGDYGMTYAVDYSIGSILLGGLIVFTSPKINKKLKEKRNGKGIPYQGMVITFSLLLIISLIVELII